MCGFAGVIAWDEKYRIDRATLERMSAAIAHRGPDGEGIYLHDQHEITPESPLVGFAFRRLAIIDLDERSNQPFVSSDKRYVMVFNGEIYNYRELRGEISKHLPDYQWRTAGDTETLLMSYVLWKEKCVEHLNGMFAIAIWDHQEKSLYLARDRMGQKPLYVGGGRGFITFGSEIHALSDLGKLVIHPILWLGDYLRYGNSLGSTPFEASLPLPGTYSLYKAGTRTVQRYFHYDRGVREVSDSDAEAITRQLLETAVQRQLVSDVPLGVFLSGGIDSSVVAACARKHGKISTFSIRFDDPRYDESRYAREVSVHLDTNHTELIAKPNLAEDLPRLAQVFGAPFADSSAIPTHLLCRETRKHVKVALSGDGGDELFGGYDRYRAMLWSQKLQFLKPFERIGRRMQRGHPKNTTTRAGRFLSSLALKQEFRYDSYLRIFQEELISELLPGKRLYPPYAEAYSMHMYGRDAVQAALACDRFRYLPDDLLQKVDRCSMLHGLEVRSPFMDHELIQFAAGLTTDQLLKGGKKRMLREAFAKDLPDFVFKRKKMGFAVPIGEWFRGELRAMLRDHLFASDGFCRQHFNMKVVERLVEEHESERIDHSQRLYALLMLEMWWVHVVKAAGGSP